MLISRGSFNWNNVLHQTTCSGPITGLISGGGGGGECL